MFAVSSATASFVEASSSNFCPVFQATLTPAISCAKSMSLKICLRTNSYRQTEKSLLANVYRQLENLFGLSGSRRNLSLYHNRLISNFGQCTESAASSDCPFLCWLCGVRSLSLQDGERKRVSPVEESLFCISVHLIQEKTFLLYPLLY